jgi:hypothetical protein
MTIHVHDYTKIVTDAMEALADKKLKHQLEIFPWDCQKTFEMGSDLPDEVQLYEVIITEANMMGK